MRRISCVLVSAMFAASLPSRAQTPDSTVVLSGRVTQAGDTTIAVGGAEVEIVGTALRRYANGDGRFRFAGMLPGTYELRVRRLGYEAASLRVVLESGRSYEQAVELHRHPNALTEVRINGRMMKVPARFEDVYARAAHENGTFFTREDIDKLNPNDVLSLLNLVPGAYTNDRGVTFQRCNGPTMRVQVYIDGTRVTTDPHIPVLEEISLVHARDIQAMEVYTSAGRLPAEFLEDACAVIAIWTKSY